MCTCICTVVGVCILCIPCVKAAGTGQAGQAKTGPLFSALGLVMIVNCIDRMVKIVT